jgi:glycerophosphoryl diester phosphodiesterase
MSKTLLVHHAAMRDHGFPPGSIAGLRACLDAGARSIEVDISLLADGDFLLYHDARLQKGTTGLGPVARCTAAQARELRLVWRGSETRYAPGTLSQALRLLDEHSQPVELQLDLKLHSPLTAGVLAGLAGMLAPYRDRVRVSSPGDWAVRALHALAPDLQLGFDPLLYLEPDLADEEDGQRPPYRMGAYGYRDDHPLAMVRWGSPADYLAARAEALWAQAPVRDAVWYIRASLLESALNDGFDWIGWLHQRDLQVDGWTLDPGSDEEVQLARRLVAAGVDRITTPKAPALARALGDCVIY